MMSPRCQAIVKPIKRKKVLRRSQSTRRDYRFVPTQSVFIQNSD